MENHQSFNYPGNPLKLEDSFRVLALEPGQGRDPVKVRLLDCLLSDHPNYEAVSYAWGDLSLTADILVSHDGDEAHYQPVPATTNCQAALKGLRYSDRERLLWIDAICINQGSVKERNHQVQMMSKIYARASRVVVYLGEHTDGSDLVMDWIVQSAEAPDYGEPGAHEPPAPPKEALAALLGRPWFHRVWVLQEISFASDCIVLCGDRAVAWSTFQQIRRTIVDAGTFVKIPYSLGFSDRKESFRYATYGFIPQARQLLNMLRSSRHCKATDPRDKIYAILPLLKRQHQRVLSALNRRLQDPSDESIKHVNADVIRQVLIVRPDYNATAAEVFTQIAKDLMQELGAGIVLREVITPCHVPGLPSWVPDWSVDWPHGKDRYRSIIDRQDDYPLYELRKTSQDSWWITDYSLPEGRPSCQLHLEAFFIGTILHLGPVCDLDKNFFPLFQWWDLAKDREHPEEALRLARQSPVSERAKNFWGALCLEETWVRRVVPLIIEMAGRYAQSSPDNPDREVSLLSFREAMFEWPYDSNTIRAKELLNACDGRRFFLTDSGCMGLIAGNLDAKIGDMLFSGQKWNRPFILRMIGILDETDHGERMVNIPGVSPGQDREAVRVFSVQGKASIGTQWVEDHAKTVFAEKTEHIILR
ncbi:hypothetical protein PFICI_04114 [Pestalotiopsis fici W106-1]|uniref:Heterokaryon incompatibility domain-containing protein n=1 Tax=Pestalotiopsis fici (strain W106-1 / CGMCC3.15140) TaxID=1229662 RepID=W3XJ86_PESFW|nr:uncharacterized protein PFICI_04114 [Pestalotiopsis fici W106-1]ETS86089.1 hypothetical protein PFICI_04114 [Pestalotiopsis fici W106-1]